MTVRVFSRLWNSLYGIIDGNYGTLYMDKPVPITWHDNPPTKNTPGEPGEFWNTPDAMYIYTGTEWKGVQAVGLGDIPHKPPTIPYDDLDTKRGYSASFFYLGEKEPSRGVAKINDRTDVEMSITLTDFKKGGVVTRIVTRDEYESGVGFVLRYES